MESTWTGLDGAAPPVCRSLAAQARVRSVERGMEYIGGTERSC